MKINVYRIQDLFYFLKITGYFGIKKEVRYVSLYWWSNEITGDMIWKFYVTIKEIYSGVFNYIVNKLQVIVVIRFLSISVLRHVEEIITIESLNLVQIVYYL